MEQTKSIQTYPIELENFGLATLSELFDDWVVYRKLEPVHRRLPGFKVARTDLGLHNQGIPRKLEDAYAQVALWIFEKAQALRGAEVKEILFIGDTLSGDGQAFQNIRRIGELPGSAFIGAERAKDEAQHSIDSATGIFTANRWSNLADWLAWSLEQGLRLDQDTVVVVDMDKTAIGARGRNDRAIDIARLTGLYRAVDSVLGEEFDRELFEKHYNMLNQPRYHHVTEDNQDYLAYICLVLNNGAIDCEDLLERINSGAIDSFEQFIRYVDTCMLAGAPVSESMRQVHEAINTSVQAGDPTPFKRFRREEFKATLEHMNNLPDDTPAVQRLDKEITITQEVREAALWLKNRGCLVMSLSDKPDEASVPTQPNQRGMDPVHKAVTHCVGVSIQKQLDALE